MKSHDRDFEPPTGSEQVIQWQSCYSDLVRCPRQPSGLPSYDDSSIFHLIQLGIGLGK